jgi:histidine triad (HIT) family protein
MCLFCKIIARKIPADIVYENDDIVAFRDIHPIAPVHVLIIPKRHIESVNDLEESDKELVGKMIIAARDIARQLKIAEEGYKLLFRVGKHGGQEVEHMHLHLIGGTKLYEEIRPV